MIKFGKEVVKYRIQILTVCILLLIPSVFGIVKTRINYDMLTYLSEGIDTVTGQDILMDDFGKGAFSTVIVEGMDDKDIAKLKANIEKVDHVDSVIWYDSILDTSVPMELLPEKIYNVFNTEEATMMAVFFDTSTSADETMDAIHDIRALVGKNCFVTGMSAMVTDLKNLCEKEEPIYVGLAVLCAVAAMMLFMDSYLIPVIFLPSIGIAIVWNLGTNVFLGEISHITKALSAVLQLAVTMDYSIFLWNSYTEQKVRFGGDRERTMAHAISNTVTTIAGFLALCFMSFTLGRDLGLVMAKGVIFGVIGCVTTLPAMILILDKPIEKTRYKPLLPKMDGIARLIIKHAWAFLTAFVIILIPAYNGYTKTEKYYDLGVTLPESMDYVIVNNKLQEEFDMGSTHMILVDSSLSQKDMKAMIKEIDAVDGVKSTLGLSSAVGTAVPEEVLPSSITGILKGGSVRAADDPLGI